METWTTPNAEQEDLVQLDLETPLIKSLAFDEWGFCVIYVPFLKFSGMMFVHAEVAKLVYALALGASGVTHGGSSPLLGTEPDSNGKMAILALIFNVFLGSNNLVLRSSF